MRMSGLKRGCVGIAIFVLAFLCTRACAADGDGVSLPAPMKSGDYTLSRALSERASSRTFADVDLTRQQLSNLLWAAAGVNRENGGRTYPTALNRLDMTVYVFTRDGVYRYMPEDNALILVASGDRRADSGVQSFVGAAAVNLAYVQDLSSWQESADMAARGAEFGFAHAGAMMQNAYLYATSQGWGAVVRGSFDHKALGKLLKLGEHQEIRLIQSIGPK